MTELLSRAETILKIIVEQYLADGAPVSSKFICELGCLHVSSATVRNTMVQLEQSGLIRSPHTSAGRVPTTQGIRLFLDKMLQLQPLPHDWQHELQLNLTAQLPPALLLQRAGQLLANLTGLVCVVSPVKAAGRGIRQVDLIRLAADRLLLVVIDEEGDVLNRVMSVTQPVDSVVLSRALCLLNGAVCGQLWPDGIGRLSLMLKNEQGALQQLLHDVMAQLSLDEMQQNQPQVYGLHHLLQSAIYQKDPGVTQTVALLENPSSLVQALCPVVGDAGTKLILGRESGVAEISDVALVALPYQANPRRFLCLIGPRRMNYALVIPLLEACGQLLSKHLNPVF